MELNRRRSLISRKSVGKFNQLSFAGNKDGWTPERSGSEIFGTNFSSSSVVHLAQGVNNRTPTSKEDLSPRHIARKVTELQEKVTISTQLTQFQRSSLNETLAALNTFVYSLAAQYPDNEIPPENYSKIQTLLWSIAQLIQNATQAGPRGIKYGIFQDRISNLSPSVSSKSYHEDDLIQASRLSVNSKPAQQLQSVPSNPQYASNADLGQQGQAYRPHVLQYPQASSDEFTALEPESHQVLQYQYNNPRPVSPAKSVSHRSSMVLRMSSPILPEDGSDSEFEDETQGGNVPSQYRPEPSRVVSHGSFMFNGVNTPSHTPTNNFSMPQSQENRRSAFEPAMQARADSAFMTPPTKGSLKMASVDFNHQLPTRNEFDIGLDFRNRPQSMFGSQRRPSLGGKSHSGYRNSYVQSNYGSSRNFDF